MRPALKRKILCLLFAVLAGCLSGPACSDADPQIDVQAMSKFFELYETGDFAGAIAAAPSRFRDETLYAKDQENLPPYKRDELIYFDIQAKASGEKAVPAQGPFDKEIFYYLGVIHYRMNDLEQARRRLLQCLRLDPGYRMAHVYLFRVYARLESDVLSKDEGKTESSGRLFIDKIGFGSSDLHLQEAMDLAEGGKIPLLGAVLLSFRFDKGVILNPKGDISPEYSPKNRAVYFDEIKRPDLYRVELVAKDRHCLDEAYFEPEQVLFWDGVDASGKMTGGRDRITTFDVSLQLAMPQAAERAVVFDAVGKKISDIRIEPNRD